MKRKKQQHGHQGQHEDLFSSKCGVSPDKSAAIRYPGSCYLAAAVSLLTLIVYLLTLRNGFVAWDDNLYVYENTHIRNINWVFFKWAFSDLSVGFWHPLTWISYAFDYSLWGMNPVGYHLTAVILHAINTFLVVYLVSKLLGDAKTFFENKERYQASRENEAKAERELAHDHLIDSDSPRKGTLRNSLPTLLNIPGVLITAGVTGLLFGLHPLHVESVAWISERKDLLCALFFLLSIIAYTGFVTALRKKNNQDKSTSIDTSLMKDKWYFDRWYLLTLVLFVFALASKTMAVSLPVVLLILDWYPYRRMLSIKKAISLLLEKTPFIAISLLISIVSISAQKTMGALVLTESVTLSARVLVASRALMIYLGKMIIPINLIPIYPYPHNVNLLSIKYFIAVSLIAGITALCIYLASKQKLWLSVWVYYVITLLPVLGIIQVGSHSMADRYTYLPSIGPFIIVGLSIAWVQDRFKKRALASNVVVAGIAIMAFSSIIYLTAQQINVWHDSFDLFGYIIKKEPGKIPLAYYNRGCAFDEVGKFEQAIEDYSKVIDLVPTYSRAYYNRGCAFDKIGRPEKAIHDYSRAIELNPSYIMAYINRGLVLSGMGRLNEAIVDFDRAIALNPLSYEAYNNKGRLYGQAGLIDKAIEQFSKAIEIMPETLAYSNRGIAFLLVGENSKALDDLNRAIALDNKNTEAYGARGNLHLKAGNAEFAVSDFQKACDLGDQKGCYVLQGLRLR